jgi:hypothetical protein
MMIVQRSFAGNSALGDARKGMIWGCGESPRFLAMDAGMTVRAKRDQILFGIVAGVAAKLVVMDFEVRHGAAVLTAPAIATQYLLT